MATLADIALAAGVNIASALIFLILFAIARIQPINDRVYFPKWYLKKLRTSPTHSGVIVSQFVNLDWKSYVTFLNWVPEALKMPEPELIDHAGLDSAVYLRIYLLGFKIFFPVALLAWSILVPVNWTNNTLSEFKAAARLHYSNIDKLSISNVPSGSPRFWAHIVMAYVFTLWTCYVLKMEYAKITEMRLDFLASARRRPDQFTVNPLSLFLCICVGLLKIGALQVLVKNVPPDEDYSVSESVEQFFLVNYSEHYLTHQVVINANKLADLTKKKKRKENWLDYYQVKYSRDPRNRPKKKTGFLGLCGNRVDAIDYQITEIERLAKEIAEEKERVINDPKCIIPAAFVSFKTRWGAAVCAQTQQTRNPTLWLTEWASEPCDVYWDNLSIPYVSLTIRRLIISVAFFFLTFFFIIPITIVQSFANIEGIEKRASFLTPIIEVPFIKSLIQGVLPGIALKIFLIVLPTILMMMSKFEGFISISSLERRSALRYYTFNFFNVFLVSVIAGTAFEQLNTFLNMTANQIPRTIGVAIPMKATFFITYVMVDGWAGVAAEVLRLKPLIIYHLKNFFLVKTERDREEAMDPGSIGFDTGEPQLQLYFLLGLVYAVITPVFLPFILVFFALAYVVNRHQIINVYNQEYESAAAFWPDVHGRIIFALIFSHIVLIGLMSTKRAASTAPFLIALPIITFFFNKYCKGRYEPAFLRYPIKDATMKDSLETAREPNLNLKAYLKHAYIHPVLKDDDGDDKGFNNRELDNEMVRVPTRRTPQRNSARSSETGQSPLLPEAIPPHN